MKVSKYMKKNPIVIQVDQTLAEVVERMIKEKTNTIVAVDSHENLKPVGMVTTLCLIKKVLPDYLEDDPMVSAFERPGQLTCFSLKYKKEPISKIMIECRKTLDPDDTMVEAAAYASKSITRSLPVVGQDGKLIGIVDRTCIKKAIYNSIFKIENPDCDHNNCDVCWREQDKD
ncbi:MAG: CBS domain-containing protein [Candidatus Moranbacteria bacterium]|nr:CBS domain-containing protein [Candidatus Moranbacteria bacterium]